MAISFVTRPKPPAVVVNAGSNIPDEPAETVVHSEKSSSQKYRDPEARKAYRREWMRRKRGG